MDCTMSKNGMRYESAGSPPKPVHELALILIAADMATHPMFRGHPLHPVSLREIAMQWITAPENGQQKETVADGYKAAWHVYRALPSLGWTHDGKARDVAACIVAGTG
jgi:hypothetical protein